MRWAGWTRIIPLWVLAALILVVGLFFLVYAVNEYVSEHRKARFVAEWSARLRDIDQLAKARPLASDPAQLVRTFATGEWIIAVNEFACRDAGYDATVMRDSTGRIATNTTYHFCGHGGMAKALTEIEADSLAEFHRRLEALYLERHSQRH